jgi:hypothetical protein
MKFVFILFCLAGMSFSLRAQSGSTYQTLIARASLLHLQRNAKDAITLYEQAFKLQQPDALTAYKAAGMFSLDSNAAKAFQYLDLAISSGWTEADWLSSDPCFEYLKTRCSESWKKVEEQAFLTEDHYARTLKYPSLRKEINMMTLKDQHLRYVRAQHTNDSLSRAIDQQISKSDYDNLNRATTIIQQYGWPKISQIGRDGQHNLWLIVQHADQDVLFQQLVLRAMQKCSATEYSMEHYAFLYDRIQCNLNYKQWYGTQVVWARNGEASAFRPMQYEYKVDQRRKKLGLQPLQIYALTYGFRYRNVTRAGSEHSDLAYKAHVRSLVDSAKYFYTIGEFAKTYDYYNTASTFIGGMSNPDNLDAALIFAKIAAVDADEKYKGIALDFLNLLFLRRALRKSQLIGHSAFHILHKEQRWRDINEQLGK